MRRAAFHILVSPLLYLVSLLPFPLLYLLSDFMFLLVFFLIGYRRQVARTNLANAFPEKTESERRTIERMFYRHLCDVTVETIKLLTISKKAFAGRCSFDAAGRAVFNSFGERKMSFVGVLGHCGNWEWAGASACLSFPQQLVSAYHPLSSPSFDRFMLRLRSRFGNVLVPMNGLLRCLLDFQRRSVPVTLGLIADQTPPPETATWVKFLNQDTPVFNGAEKIAARFDYPVVFVSMMRKKRGHYVLSAKVITETAGALSPGEITRRHAALLESNIRAQPFAWLWTHRRWKHKKPATLH